MIEAFRRIYKGLKDLSARYPAFLSGLVIYLYLMFSIAHFLLRSRSIVPSFTDILETFDALPFMWFLSVALVKIIEVRGRLYTSETQRMLAEKQIELKQTQLKTLHEVVKSMQHHINNPLAIIALAIGPARRAGKDNPDLNRQLDVIEDSTQRIIRTLKSFFESESYETERVDAVVGNIATLPGESLFHTAKGGSAGHTPDPEHTT